MNNIDFQTCIEEILNETRSLIGQGLVADYIPALAEALGVHFLAKPISAVIARQALALWGSEHA